MRMAPLSFRACIISASRAYDDGTSRVYVIGASRAYVGISYIGPSFNVSCADSPNTGSSWSTTVGYKKPGMT
jgi:hypothetical protein